MTKMTKAEQAMLDCATKSEARQSSNTGFYSTSPGSAEDAIWQRIVAKGHAHLSAAPGDPGVPFNLYRVGAAPALVDVPDPHELQRLLATG